MLQLTRTSFVCTETSTSLAAMRREFDQHSAIRLPQFLNAELLLAVQHSVRHASFYERDHSGIAREACMVENATVAMMSLIMNDPSLFEVMSRLTGCVSIRYFGGRIYAMHADANHYDRWHSDAIEDRQVGISVNLSEGKFDGGVFELRHIDRDDVEWSLSNTGAGDATLFRIRADLVHRVTPVVGPIPRVAYAGWFKEGPDLLAVLKNHERQRAAVPEPVQYTDATATT